MVKSGYSKPFTSNSIRNVIIATYFENYLDEPNSTTKKEKCVSNNPVQFIRTPPIKATYSTDDSQEDNFSILMSPTATPIMETKSLFPTPSPADGDKLWHCHSPHPMVVIPMEQLMSPLLENEVLTIDQVRLNHHN